MPIQFQRRQQTLTRVCRVSGRGYWTGKPVTVTCCPAPPDTGIVFRRRDLANCVGIQAVASQRTETPLRTKLVGRSSSVEMIEHVMAALYAMEVDNCIVECNGAEMPGLDGSALAYCLAIDEVGLSIQNRWVRTFSVDEPLRIGDESQWIELGPALNHELTCEYHLEYDYATSIPTGHFRSAVTPDTFLSEVASARTFVTKMEATTLQAKGLASHVTYRDLLVFDERGPIDNILRFHDESVRHKLLDLVGDLALCGVRLLGSVRAYRSGHILNGRMAARIVEEYQKLSCQTPIARLAA